MDALLSFVPNTWSPLVKNSVSALIVVLLAMVLYRVIKGWINRARKKKALSAPVASAIRLVVRWSVVLMTLLIVLQQFGLLANAWAALTAVLALVAVGFVAVWSVMSNISCTVLILISRPFQVGDQVELPTDNLGGKVIDLNMLFTTLRTDDGALIQIPNNLFFQKPVRRLEGRSTVELSEQLGREQPAE